MQNNTKNTSFMSTGDLSGLTGIRHQQVLNRAVHSLKGAGIDPEKYVTLRKTPSGNIRAELDLPEKICMVAVSGEFYDDAFITAIKRTFKVWRKSDAWDRANPIFS